MVGTTSSSKYLNSNLMEIEEDAQNNNQDILDSTVIGHNAKLFTCKLCDQKFTNKVIIYH